MLLTCSHCGAQMPEISAFCPGCGMGESPTGTPSPSADTEAVPRTANEQPEVQPQITEKNPRTRCRRRPARARRGPGGPAARRWRPLRPSRFGYCTSWADIMTRELVDLMADAGTVWVTYAVESGSPRVRSRSMNFPLHRLSMNRCVNSIMKSRRRPFAARSGRE